MKTKRICIVTPDIVGPVTNGGIGTHCFYLAKFLGAQKDFDVTALFTLEEGAGQTRLWNKFYESYNVRFVALADNGGFPYHVEGCERFGRQSALAHEYLASQHFDAIHFQDWRAGGFAAIQAKRAGLAYAETLLTVTMHSPHQWQHQGMELWHMDPGMDILQGWCERYCCLHADVLISPTQHMFDWAKDNHWDLADDQRIVRLCYKPDAAPQPPEGEADSSHLVFFGRLETRKGLAVFCNGLAAALKRQPNLVRKVSFLGKIALTEGVPGDQFVQQALSRFTNLELDIKTDLDTFQALDYIKQQRAVVVIPSLLDNSPYTVIECIENKIPFLASRTGGIPELANEACLFDATAAELSKRLLQLPTLRFSELSHPYSNELAESQWFSLHEELPVTAPPLPEEWPLVSVCVPHYNHAKYLPTALQSLEAQDYPNIEVIVVDDNSSDLESVEVFEAMRGQYQQWTFLRQDTNKFASAARNAASHNAKGRYLLFMDADNIALPHMVGDMVRSMQRTDMDCYTCWARAFSDNDPPHQYPRPVFAYHPAGPCLEFGCLSNVFGDTNFIIKVEVFEALGGFPEDNKGLEDWEFLARLNLRGYTQDVLPKYLLWYRVTDSSVSKRRNEYACHMNILRAYYERDPVLGRLASELAAPMWRMLTEGHAALQEDTVAHRAFHKIITRINRVFPLGSRRRETAKQIGRNLFKI